MGLSGAQSSSRRIVENASSVKVVHDNVLGPIELDDGLVRIIDTPLFQRLRRLEQLGTASLVFPGARHTRFEHSLGAQEIMRRAVQRLRGTPEGADICEREERILRVAALVHDLGHYPLSHVIEYVVFAIQAYSQDDSGLIEVKDSNQDDEDTVAVDLHDESRWLQIASLGDQVERSSAAHHESLTARILKKDNDLGQAIKCYIGGSDPVAEVIEVLQKTTRDKFKRQLVSSELDVDRLDYLVRDSYYTGVTFGTVEVDHLIRRLWLHRSDGSEQRQLVVDERARPIVEHYLLGRHFMYSQVPYHRVVTAFSVLAGAVWIALHVNGTRKTSIESVHDALDSGAYGSYDDSWYWQKVAMLSREESSFGGKLARDLIHRRPPALAFEERRRGDALLNLARERFDRRRDELADGSKLSAKDMFLTDQKISIATELSKERYDEMLGHEDYIPDEVPLVRRERNGRTDIVPITGLAGSIAQRLSANEDREQIVRVYCARRDDLSDAEFKDRLDALEKLCRREFGLY